MKALRLHSGPHVTDGGRHGCTRSSFAFAKASVLAAGLALITASCAEHAILGRPDSGKFALAKPGMPVSAGRNLIRVDSIRPAVVYVSLFGPDGTVFKTDSLPTNLWRPYHADPAGKTLFYVKATTDATGREAFFRISF